MPASQVMKKFKAGKLHSGSKKGPVVKNPAQARAIQISEARDEGHNIPKPNKSARTRNKRLEKAKM
jgi:Family of unknown function (DUF6496)